MKDKFCTNVISDAAYLMGPKNIRLINATKDEDGVFKIVLDISPEQAKDLLFQFPNSESVKFDRCVVFLKRLLCPKTKKRGNNRSP
jgi:hypothetical protein